MEIAGLFLKEQVTIRLKGSAAAAAGADAVYLA